MRDDFGSISKKMTTTRLKESAISDNCPTSYATAESVGKIGERTHKISVAEMRMPHVKMNV